MSNAQLGYGKRRLVAEIIKKTWDVEDPYQIKLGLNDIYYIVQEMNAEEGKAYLENRPLSARGFNVFRYFAQHLLYRNLANYDSMVLLTSDKGCLTDDAKIMLPRDLLKYPDGVPIKDLIGKGEIYVYSFNINTKKLELKKSDGVEFVKNDDVYEVELTTGQKINATSEHPFLLMDGSYKQLKDLVWLGGWKDTDRLRMIFPKVSKYGGIIKNIKYLGKKNVYDIVNVRDNHNFIANGFVVSNSGKCLYIRDEKDFVVSANGELIHPKDANEIILMDQNMKMQTSKIKKRYNRKETDVYEVKLRSGKSICLTKEHPLYTITGWKELQHLKENDFIATPRTYNKLKNNEEMNIGLVKTLAYLIADGFMGGRKLEFTKIDQKIRDDFKKSLKQYDETLEWGESVRITTTKPTTFKENGDFEKRHSLINYLRSVGLYEKRSGDKFIPKDIFRIKNEQIAVFLNRLYSCDGAVEINKKAKSKEITYTSKSELLIKQMQHLLLRFDIISRYNSKFKRATNAKNHKGSTYYQLTISGKENIINFYKKINFYQEEKRKKLEQIYNESLLIESNTNVDVIPEGILNDYCFKHSNKEYAKIFKTKQFRKFAMRTHNVSLKQFKTLAKFEDDEKLNMFANSDIFWDKIKSITQLQKNDYMVYDLETDNENHNFVANDIIIHNSSAAILLARAWCNIIGIKFNPSRHIAYSNRDVMNKIEILNKWEPLIADESVRFCCVEGNTLIQTKEGEFRIKDLVDKTNFEVLSYDEKTKQFEYKKAEKCIKTKTDYVYELETFCGKKIRCTKEHKFLTNDGWKKLEELIDNDILINDLKTKSITKLTKIQTYDIINVKDNNNYIANGFIVHNSTMDWAKKESKELRKKLAEVRTKHLLFILCFPLKVTKVEKTYLDSFVNYWIALFGRGVGSIFVKDQNPANDPWRIKEFKDIGSYTEFTSITDIEKKLKKHPNFWQIIKFPKPPDWLYQKYLEIREKNVYNEDSVRESVTVEDVHRALMVLALQDIMMNDVTFSMNRIALHIKNTYDIPITKKHIQAILYDSKQLITKIREEEIDAK